MLLRLGGERNGERDARQPRRDGHVRCRVGQDVVSLLSGGVPDRARRRGGRGPAHARHRWQLDQLRRRDEGDARRIHRGRMAGRVSAARDEQGRVHPGVPQGVPRYPRLSPRGPDGPGDPRADRGRPPRHGVRRRRAGRSRPRSVRDPPRCAAGDRRSEREGRAMTDGLLLIHAFPLDARMWSAQLDRRHAIAPDLPGFGASPAATGGVLTMDVGARRCIDALDAAGLDQVVVCGLSMGGYVAFELWRQARQRFAGLILANTRAGADTPEGAEARRTLAARLGSEGNVLAESPPPLLSEDPPEGLWDVVKGWIREQPAEAIAAAALGMAERPDSTPDLPTIDVPTLVITSEGDLLIPAEISAPMADQIPGAQLAVIPGAGHLSNLEDPTGFSRLIDTHLERCGVGP